MNVKEGLGYFSILSYDIIEYVIKKIDECHTQRLFIQCNKLLLQRFKHVYVEKYLWINMYIQDRTLNECNEYMLHFRYTNTVFFPVYEQLYENNRNLQTLIVDNLGEKKRYYIGSFGQLRHFELHHWTIDYSFLKHNHNIEYLLLKDFQQDLSQFQHMHNLQYLIVPEYYGRIELKKFPALCYWKHAKGVYEYTPHRRCKTK